MKKFFLILALVLVGAVVFGATSFGIGNPYSVTAANAGDIYRNMSTGTLWKANSTTKGDWTQLPPVVADGSALAPFTSLQTTNLTATNVNSVTTLKMIPSDYPTDTSATGTIFLASTSLKLNVLTSTAGSGTWSEL
jgi:hypothetical protein